MSGCVVRRRVAAWVVAAAGTALAASVPASPLAAQREPQVAAQGGGVVTGRVTESGSGRPLDGAQVGVVGTRLGAVSDANGNYRIPNVPAGAHTLRVRRIGYGFVTRDVTVTPDGPNEVAFALSPAVTELDRVVVTGTAGEAQKRSVGNAITQLDVDDLTKKSAITNVTETLQGKTPGVTILPGSGTPGTSADIRIRGTSSLVGSNRPIFYVDGVRYYDGQNGNLKSAGNGIDNAFSQGTSAIDMINPEDIESIEVIKGPAAATLYGSDAAGGVVQIITKKGARGSQRVQWNVKTDLGQNEMTLDWPTNYTLCTAARIAARQSNGDPTWPGCQGQTANAVISGQPLASDPNALRTGTYQNLVASARGGSERASFYLSGERSTNEGIYFNSYENRKGARGNFNYTVNDKLDLAVNSSYMQSQLRLPYESEGAGGLIISGVRAEPGSFRGGGLGWRFQTPASANIYNNRTDIERTILGGTVNYRPLSWLRNRFTAGVDFNSPLAQVIFPPFVQFSSDIDPTFASGVIVQQQRPTHLYTFDYAGTVSNLLPVLGGLQSDLSVGVQGVKNQVRFTQARGDGLPGPDFLTVAAATTRSGTTDFSEQSSLGYFVQEQLGYANRLFVTGAVRADDNSAFGTKFDKVYYPKASLSYVISEEPAAAGLFQTIRADNVKLRFAYGQAGRSPGPYDAARTYSGTRVVLGNGATGAIIAGSPGNENLKPERGTEFEGGFDAAFFRNRASVEFTGYRKTTTDALLSLPAPPSSGFTAAQYINFGGIRNTGTELGLRLTPVATRPVTWDMQFNYATNHNVVTQLNRPGIDRILLSNVYTGTGSTQQVRERYPVAGFWARDAIRNPDGSLALTSTGQIQLDTAKYVGPSTPTREGAVSSTVTLFGSVRLYALVDFHYGAYLFNAKDRQRSISGLDERMNIGSTRADTLYYQSSQVIRPWIQKTDYVKFRDLSLGYTLPPMLTSRLGRGTSATITLAAHNLGFISKKYPGMDPEVSYVGQGSFLTGRSDLLNLVKIDSYATPNARRLTGSLNLSF